MIGIATLNLCFNFSSENKSFEYGEMDRVFGSRKDIPGKVIGKNFCKVFIEETHMKRVPCILCVEKECLIEGLQTRSICVKPTEYESVFSTFSLPAGMQKDIVKKAYESIKEKWVQFVCDTFGKEGFTLINKDTACFFEAPEISEKSGQCPADPVGAGKAGTEERGGQWCSAGYNTLWNAVIKNKDFGSNFILFASLLKEVFASCLPEKIRQRTKNCFFFLLCYTVAFADIHYRTIPKLVSEQDCRLFIVLRTAF